MKLQELADKDRFIFKKNLEEMRKHIESIKNKGNFLHHHYEAEINFACMKGYIYALSIYGIITEEEEHELITELIKESSLNSLKEQA